MAQTIAERLLLMLALGVIPGVALAQAYPSKPVWVISPLGSGGAVETMGRLVTRKMSESLGQQFLIDSKVGAGGTIGTYSVQFAKYYGAEVTGVDKPGKLEMLRSIGADYVIDYTKEDFTKNGLRYDVILDTIGKSPFSRSLRSLKEHGTYLNANPGLFGGLWMRIMPKSSKRVITWTAGYTTANLLALKELIEAGVMKPVIDRRYPLEQTAEAHRYVDTGNKKGNVVITMK